MRTGDTLTLNLSFTLFVFLFFGMSNLLAVQSAAGPDRPLLVVGIMFARTWAECRFRCWRTYCVKFAVWRMVKCSPYSSEVLHCLSLSSAWICWKVISPLFSTISCQPWTGARQFQVVFSDLGSTMHVGRPHQHFLFHCKICWRLNSAQRLCAPVLSNNELRGAIGRCLFDAADTVMPLCGVSKWMCVCVCSRVYVYKGWGKVSVVFGWKIICQRSDSIANTPHKPNKTCSVVFFICPTSPGVIMGRWQFHSSHPPINNSLVNSEGERCVVGLFLCSACSK